MFSTSSSSIRLSEIAAARIPPVLVPQMRSNISWIFRPVAASIRRKICIVTRPLMPPPSRLKIRIPCASCLLRMPSLPTARATSSFMPRMAKQRMAANRTASLTDSNPPSSNNSESQDVDLDMLCPEPSDTWRKVTSPLPGTLASLRSVGINLLSACNRRRGFRWKEMFPNASRAYRCTGGSVPLAHRDSKSSKSTSVNRASAIPGDVSARLATSRKADT
mmetsp:Transcript_3244/g.11758  ORF Transcript_3244/g.11758 Transcript_3244/m.11758 type:complete len:220 (+) Transcript_3244:2032-2691(+)